MFDDRPVAGGATRASAGMLAPYVEAHERGPLLELAVRSLDLFDDSIAAVRRESGIDVEYRRVGTLEVALDPKHAADLRRQASDEIPAEWLEPAAARAAYPQLGWIAGALFTRSHGYVAAPQLAASLARAAERHGTNVPPRGRSSASRPADRPVRVTTADGDCEADTVVITAGTWGSAIEGVRMPPLRPVRDNCCTSAGAAILPPRSSGDPGVTSSRARTARCWWARRLKRWVSTSGRRPPECASC